MADETPIEAKEDVPEIAPFDPTKKKKKKKVVIQDPADDSVDKFTEKTESLSVSEGVEIAFVGLKKKKKKPVETDTLDDGNVDAGEDLDDHIGENEEGEGIVLQSQYPWEGTDRDYEYEELLSRVFHILRENNPELAGDRRRTVMRPPQVLREGTKKTVFVNFMELCKTMHRQPEHVMTFLLAEMGTSGSLDGQQRLVVKGRFAPKNFEGILRRYVNEYVICNGCKSPDTILSKENRLFFLRCEQMSSSQSSHFHQRQTGQVSNRQGHPTCLCGMRAPVRTSYTEANPGRRFYGCTILREMQLVNFSTGLTQQCVKGAWNLETC